ncbi:MAG TPA: hypothetical protein PL193_03960 [Xanthobacteraceae bacterium]|nr:hypothetical protein [Xanthobacteraceae bacterium]
MAEDDNPLEGAEFEAALAKLQGNPESAALVTLITSLRDAVLDLQEQMQGGDDDDEDEDDDD